MVIVTDHFREPFDDSSRSTDPKHIDDRILRKETKKKLTVKDESFEKKMEAIFLKVIVVKY